MDQIQAQDELATQSTPAQYGQEVLCASWNPHVTEIGEPAKAARQLAAETKSVDGDAFLDRFYRSQQG